jgi:hypothetical protein
MKILAKQPQSFADLVGRTLAVVSADSERVTLVTQQGDVCILYHRDDCCESVWLEEIVGDLADLIGSPLLVAEERVSNDEPPLRTGEESYTWTFYELRTVAASVTLRWYGTSNGYYSESVDFEFAGEYAPKDDEAWTIAGDYAEAEGLDLRGHYEAYFTRFHGT